MGVANCPQCGKIYMENPAKLCPACYAAFEADEEKVVEFLRKKRKASLEEIHTGTGVPHKVILRMLKQHRLTSEFQVSYPCESCGAMITGGRLCADCTKNVLDQVKPLVSKQAEKPAQGQREQKMHIGERFHR
ncbi:MAG: YvyF: flagellar operon protein [Firmicutes bacterium]|nr:YvyF: flagellar operon protein [Bacillota bacterium]